MSTNARSSATAPQALWEAYVTTFANAEYGGFVSAIDYDGTRAITADRTVESYALARWAAAETGFTAGQEEFTGGLASFQDGTHGGYLEFLEVSGIPHELSSVKTAHRQFLVAAALLEAAVHGAADIAAGRTQLEYATGLFQRDGRLLGSVARDGSSVLDDRSPAAGAAARLLALGRLARLTEDPADREAAAGAAKALVAQFVEADGSVPDWRGLDGAPVPTAKVDLTASSLTALALLETGRVLDDADLVAQAVAITEYHHDHLWDGRFGGHWNHCDLDGQITIHREFITLLNSAIPIKTATANAWALLASGRVLAALAEAGEQNGKIAASVARTRGYLESLVDTVHGGVFIGEGYFWTPPGTPVGPFVRQMLPPRDTPGVFHFGSSNFLRLYNKQAVPQILTALALAATQDSPTDDLTQTGPTKAEAVAALSASLRGASAEIEDIYSMEGVDLSGVMDVERHLNYIRSAFNPGQGYGWTPRIAPLGSGANSAPSVFGTHHSVANLRVLGEDPQELEQVTTWLTYAQAPNGAFAEFPGGPADVLNSYLAVNAFQLLGHDAGPRDREGAIRFLQSCQNEDGGFGVVPGFVSDLFHTNLAVVALDSLGSAPADPEACVRYVLASRNEDGGYGERVGTPSDTYSVYRAVGTLALLGKDLPFREEAVRFLQDCQGPGGGFSHDLVSRESLIATYHAVAALFLLGSEPLRPLECQEWLSGCQTPDGGFSNIPGVTSGTIDEGFAAVQSLAILAKGLTPYFAIAVS
ncbi:prenyltransferase/squalene oxidase repeat-containing protein [Streptomyces sp. NPDC032472]|uniref:prenyltransferase/squalene oxidase repeat-containing protein n=1 Tax=Streptomyces sp. NPDC032472 TaxID=3155018 RepID=UPI00340FDBAA